MNAKYFLKQELTIFKLIYLIGIISFLKHLNDLTIGDNQQSLIFLIVALSSLIFFFIRLIIYDKKNNDL
jgi:hypothetical protein